MSRPGGLQLLGIATALPCLLLNGCTYSMQEKGITRGLEVERVIEPQGHEVSLEWVHGERWLRGSFFASQRPEVERGEFATRAGGQGAEGNAGADSDPVWVLQAAVNLRSDVQLTRTRTFSTINWEASYHPLFPLWEVLELATSPLYLLIIPAVVLSGVAPPDDAPGFHISSLSRWKMAFAPINPFVPLFGVTITREETTDDVLFVEEEEPETFRSSFPVRGETVRYRLLDRSGNEVGKGTATTDPFGEVVFAATGPAELVTWLEGKAGGPSKNEVVHVRPGQVATVEVTVAGETGTFPVPGIPAQAPPSLR